MLAARRNVLFLRNLLRADPAVWRHGLVADLRLGREVKERGAIQKLREFVPLIALVRRLRPRTVVEIGTAAGGSFYAWCAVADSTARVISIDLPGGSFGGGYAEADIPRLRSYGRAGQRLSFIRADSHLESTRERVSAALDGEPINFLMIDGDHTYDGVRRDFELYAPLLAPKGTVAFHDIVPHPSYDRCEVHLFWNELKAEYRHVEFVDPVPDPTEGQWGGIGVLFWGV
jgi:cephalosporin hydroxylase